MLRSVYIIFLRVGDLQSMIRNLLYFSILTFHVNNFQLVCFSYHYHTWSFTTNNIGNAMIYSRLSIVLKLLRYQFILLNDCICSYETIFEFVNLNRNDLKHVLTTRDFISEFEIPKISVGGNFLMLNWIVNISTAFSQQKIDETSALKPHKSNFNRAEVKNVTYSER